MKKNILCATVLCVAYPTLSTAGDINSRMEQAFTPFVNKINGQSIFQWVEAGATYADKKISIQTTAFKNLKESKYKIWFLQASYHNKNAVNNLSLDVGYRHLVKNNHMQYPMILGATLFADGQDATEKVWSFNPNSTYQQYGMGIEAKTHTFDISANVYRLIHTQKVILDRVVQSGYDINFKSHIHHNEKWLVGVTAYQFDNAKVNTSKTKGHAYLVEYRPNQIITIKGVHDRPQGTGTNTHITINFKFSFGKSLQDHLHAHPHTTKNPVWHKRYDKTYRRHKVRTASTK